MALNPKQQRFVLEYLKDQNATQAAIRAGYSKKTAGSQAHDLLKKPEISGAISRKSAVIQERAEFNAEQVIRQLERMVMFDVRRLFHANGSPKEVTELDDDTATVVAGLEVVEQYEGTGKERQFTGYLKKYKLSDRLGAVNTALKMFGKLSEKHEVTGKDGAPLLDLSPNDIARRIAFALAKGMKEAP